MAQEQQQQQPQQKEVRIAGTAQAAAEAAAAAAAAGFRDTAADDDASTDSSSHSGDEDGRDRDDDGDGEDRETETVQSRAGSPSPSVGQPPAKPAFLFLVPRQTTERIRRSAFCDLAELAPAAAHKLAFDRKQDIKELDHMHKSANGNALPEWQIAAPLWAELIAYYAALMLHLGCDIDAVKGMQSLNAKLLRHPLRSLFPRAIAYWHRVQRQVWADSKQIQALDALEEDELQQIIFSGVTNADAAQAAQPANIFQTTAQPASAASRRTQKRRDRKRRAANAAKASPSAPHQPPTGPAQQRRRTSARPLPPPPPPKASLFDRIDKRKVNGNDAPLLERMAKLARTAQAQDTGTRSGDFPRSAPSPNSPGSQPSMLLLQGTYWPIHTVKLGISGVMHHSLAAQQAMQRLASRSGFTIGHVDSNVTHAILGRCLARLSSVQTKLRRKGVVLLDERDVVSIYETCAGAHSPQTMQARQAASCDRMLHAPANPKWRTKSSTRTRAQKQQGQAAASSSGQTDPSGPQGVRIAKEHRQATACADDSSSKPSHVWARARRARAAAAAAASQSSAPVELTAQVQRLSLRDVSASAAANAAGGSAELSSRTRSGIRRADAAPEKATKPSGVPPPGNANRPVPKAKTEVSQPDVFGSENIATSAFTFQPLATHPTPRRQTRATSTMAASRR